MSKPRAKMKTNSSTPIHRSIRSCNTPARATHRHLTVARAGGGGGVVGNLNSRSQVFKRNTRFIFQCGGVIKVQSSLPRANGYVFKVQDSSQPNSQTAKALAELESHMPSIPPKLRKEASNVRSNLFSLCVRSLRAEWNLYINIKLCFIPATSVATRIGISCFLNELMTLSLSNWSISPCNNTTE